MPTQPIIHLSKEQFSAQERPLAEHGELVASGFRYPSGVEAVRLANSRGALILLPYQGQQIWSARFDGRELTMKSMFDQPYPTQDLLATLGAFLFHCGATASGVPGPEDKHALHGELPNAPYQAARLVFGEDERGVYLGLTGDYRHTIAFNYNFLAQPEVRLYAGSTVFTVSMTVTNLKNSLMPLMYLAHVNFRPVDYGKLFYTAHPTPEHVRVRASFPPYMQVKPEFRRFVEQLKDHPEKHHIFEPDMVFDPELVFFIDHFADEEGWAHTMQLHPDGTADVLRHRPDQLKRTVRWICRTPDQQSLGFEPGTAETEGYTAELAKGNLQWLSPGGVFHCEMQIGLLEPQAARQEQQWIEGLVQLRSTQQA